MVGRRVGLAAQLAHDATVDGHLAVEDELLGRPARRDTGSGDQFLKAF